MIRVPRPLLGLVKSMHRRVLRCSSFAAILLGTACANQSASVGGPATGSVLAGQWSQDNTVLGSSLSLSLSVSDTVVTGTGAYTIEAGRPGTLTVSGVATPTHVSLDFTYDSGALAHFDGTLPVGAVLAGAIKYGPKDAMIPSYSITFHKAG
jgi:hypothetical protein